MKKGEMKMANHKEIFRSFTRQRKNSIFTRKVIKSELIIPSGAIEITQEEMEYLTGGAIDIRFERSGIFRSKIDLVISGTVADLINIIGGIALTIGGFAGLLMLIPGIGNVAALKLICSICGIVAGLSQIVNAFQFTQNINFNFRFSLT